ncbi:MAG: thioredoxin [Planctomycetales bacterium]|nr:thioredoxin [Planctomycetales bacterium]
MATAQALHLSDQDFDAEVLNSAEPVLVDFYATWCPPCRMIAPVMEQLATAYAGQAKVVKVNVDESPMLANRYGVQGVPTVMVFHRGRVANTLVGAQSVARYQAALDRLL